VSRFGSSRLQRCRRKAPAGLFRRQGEKGVAMDTTITIHLTPEQYNTVLNVSTVLDWSADDLADVFYDAVLGQAAHFHVENNV